MVLYQNQQKEKPVFFNYQIRKILNSITKTNKITNKRLLAFIVLTFCFLKTAFSQEINYYNPNQTKALFSILDLDFSKSRQQHHYPIALDFQLKSLGVFLETILNCNKEEYLLGKVHEVKWQDSLSRTPDCPEKLFAKSQIKLHWAILSYMYGDRVNAAFKMRQVYTILHENYKKYPNHKPTQLYFGFMNIYLAEIPDSFQWLTDLIGLNGNAELGQKLIESSKSNHPVLELERQLLTIEKKSQFEDQEENATKIVEKILTEKGFHPTTKAITALYFVKNKNAAKANVILNELEYDKYPLFHYIKGLTAFHMLDFKTASSYFKTFNKRNLSENFKKDVALHLAYISYLEGDSVQAKKLLASIHHKGNDALFADKKANRLSTEKLPDKNILMSRIAFDGGNWLESRNWLIKWKAYTEEDKAEFYYRLARIEQKMNNVEYSKKCYKSSIGYSHNHSHYYGPFSCLYLADIYIKESNKNLAKHYYDTSNVYTDFEHKATYAKKHKELKKHLDSK